MQDSDDDDENKNISSRIIEEEEVVGPSERHVHALKLYAINCAQWDHLSMNQLSVDLLLICSLIDCIAKLWVNFLCLEYESMENLSSIMFGAAIIVLTIPLLLDLLFLFAQRVNPGSLSSLMQTEIRAFQAKYSEVLQEALEWHMWALDKSSKVCTLKVRVTREGKQDSKL